MKVTSKFRPSYTLWCWVKEWRCILHAFAAILVTWYKSAMLESKERT